MTARRKVDSNETDLRYAEEASIGVLPGSPIWKPLEPNSYGEFGGEIKTVARRPINVSRQRKKGVVVDVDANGDFNMDLTQTNLQDLMQGFMFADHRDKDDLVTVTVDGTANAYLPATGGAGYIAGDLLFAKDHPLAANNGLKVVSGAPTASSVPVTDTALVTDTAGSISRVGVQFPSGLASIDADPGVRFPKLVLANTTAVGTFTLGANSTNNDTVTIGTQVYTFKGALTGAADEIKIGASASATLDNMVAAINTDPGEGVAYGTGTTSNEDVYPTVAGAGDTVIVTARAIGAAGNLITTTEVGADSSWGSATLLTGAGRDLTTLGIIPGEPVFIGGDQTAEQFAISPLCNGFARVRSVATNEMIFDKTDNSMTDDAGTGKTIHLYFGRVLKNESDGDLQVRRSYQLERLLGKADTTDVGSQSEYLTGSVPNEFEIGYKESDKVTVDLTFVSQDHETYTAAQGVKSGTRPDLEESDGFNSTSDIARIALSLVSTTDSDPTPLFAFITNFKLSIKNNVKQNKAVSVLGSFDSTAGIFEVDADLEAYFTTVEAIDSVRSNADVTLDMHIVKDNVGISFDMPLVTLGNGRAKVELDEPIMLPLTNMAASGARVHADLNHTLLIVFWDYLPTAAAQE